MVRIDFRNQQRDIFRHSMSARITQDGISSFRKGFFDRSRNTRDTVYGAQVLVGFDECAVVAVNVDVPEYSAVASGDV